MILVDTSVWIEHLRHGSVPLTALLHNGAVLAHPWVVGELALGNLRHRDEIIGMLGGLPQATVAKDAEVLMMIEQEPLHGAGIGYIDAHLLAATRLTPDAKLWTRDKRLATVSARLGLSFEMTPQPESRS